MAQRTRPEQAGEISVDATGVEVEVVAGVDGYVIVNDSNGASDILHIGITKHVKLLPTTGEGQFPLSKDESLSGTFNPINPITRFSFKSGGAAVIVRFIFV